MPRLCQAAVRRANALQMLPTWGYRSCFRLERQLVVHAFKRKVAWRGGGVYKRQHSVCVLPQEKPRCRQVDELWGQRRLHRRANAIKANLTTSEVPSLQRVEIAQGWHSADKPEEPTSAAMVSGSVPGVPAIAVSTRS